MLRDDGQQNAFYAHMACTLKGSPGIRFPPEGIRFASSPGPSSCADGWPKREPKLINKSQESAFSGSDGPDLGCMHITRESL